MYIITKSDRKYHSAFEDLIREVGRKLSPTSN